jgi:chemotaxis protein histidine kinase CheA
MNNANADNSVGNAAVTIVTLVWVIVIQLMICVTCYKATMADLKLDALATSVAKLVEHTDTQQRAADAIKANERKARNREAKAKAKAKEESEESEEEKEEEEEEEEEEDERPPGLQASESNPVLFVAPPKRKKKKNPTPV